ncbi:MAG: hypothetical protein LBK77_02945 [Spirochaetaceae bacterium]|jgi:chromosome segregation ATPase|nr:hypothetical protein [Spirochaetaceae bacterium]
MDDRYRAIRVLNEKRREDMLFRTRILEDLGRSLAERLDGGLPGAREGDYRRFKQEIAESEASIEVIQGALARIKALDEEISVKLMERADRREEASALYLRCGRLLLDLRPVPAECGPYSRQRELSLARFASLEDRLRELEAGSGGIFSWLSRVIQALIIRSSLKRIGRQLDRICLQAGEAYAGDAASGANAAGGTADPAAGGANAAGGAADPAAGGAPRENPGEDLSPLLRDIRALRQNLAELDGALGVLEREKAKIRASFGFPEKPARRIKILQERAGRRRQDLQELYLRIGESAAAVFGDSLNGEDRAALEKAGKYGDSAEETRGEIERIEAGIAVDKEREKILKFEKAVSGRKTRAAENEKNIAELNRKIAEANKRIDELQSRSTDG